MVAEVRRESKCVCERENEIKGGSWGEGKSLSKELALNMRTSAEWNRGGTTYRVYTFTNSNMNTGRQSKERRHTPEQDVEV